MQWTAIAALCVVIAVSGCLGPGAADRGRGEEPFVVEVPVEMEAPAGYPEYCTPAGLCMTGYASDREDRALLLNQTLVGFDLEMDIDADGGTYHWALTCRGAAPECSDDAPLAETQGASSPLRLEADGLHVPGRADLVHIIDYESQREPVIQHRYRQDVAITGTYRIEVDPTVVEPPRKAVEKPVHIEATTGPCIISAEPHCNSYPGWVITYAYGGEDGSAQNLSLVMEWDALTPLTEELRLQVACVVDIVTLCDGTGPLYFQGTSPLVIESVLPGYAEGSWVEFDVREPLTPEDVSRQPYTMTGHVTFLVPDDA